jgi:N6-adenosine-specific RNA methylase IME4
MTGKYQVIYCDPPWWFSNRRIGNGGASCHYPLMRDSELIALRPSIDEIADEDCAMFMWASFARFDFAVDLLKEWGFRWVTVAFAWVKVANDYVVSDDYRTVIKATAKCQCGHYTSSNIEPCVLGLRGSMPVNERMIPQVAFHPVLRHSEKPQVFRDKIQRMYPEARKLEMFCRHAPEGWDTWGNEVGKLEENRLIVA